MLSHISRHPDASGWNDLESTAPMRLIVSARRFLSESLASFGLLGSPVMRATVVHAVCTSLPPLHPWVTLSDMNLYLSSRSKSTTGTIVREASAIDLKTSLSGSGRTTEKPT